MVKLPTLEQLTQITQKSIAEKQREQMEKIERAVKDATEGLGEKLTNTADAGENSFVVYKHSLEDFTLDRGDERFFVQSRDEPTQENSFRIKIKDMLKCLDEDGMAKVYDEVVNAGPEQFKRIWAFCESLKPLIEGDNDVTSEPSVYIVIRWLK
jgi:hypothetical protein